MMGAQTDPGTPSAWPEVVTRPQSQKTRRGRDPCSADAPGCRRDAEPAAQVRVSQGRGVRAPRALPAEAGGAKSRVSLRGAGLWGPQALSRSSQG